MFPRELQFQKQFPCEGDFILLGNVRLFVKNAALWTWKKWMRTFLKTNNAVSEAERPEQLIIYRKMHIEEGPKQKMVVKNCGRSSCFKAQTQPFSLCLREMPACGVAKFWRIWSISYKTIAQRLPSEFISSAEWADYDSKVLYNSYLFHFTKVLYQIARHPCS